MHFPLCEKKSMNYTQAIISMELVKFSVLYSATMKRDEQLLKKRVNVPSKGTIQGLLRFHCLEVLRQILTTFLSSAVDSGK